MGVNASERKRRCSKIDRIRDSLSCWKSLSTGCALKSITSSPSCASGLTLLSMASFRVTTSSDHVVAVASAPDTLNLAQQPLAENRVPAVDPELRRVDGQHPVVVRAVQKCLVNLIDRHGR